MEVRVMIPMVVEFLVIVSVSHSLYSQLVPDLSV